MSGSSKISNKPIVWGLFAGGGTLTAFLTPVLVLLTLLVAFDVIPANINYDTMYGFASHWLGKIVLFGVIFLSLWHAAHRFRITLHDFGIRADILVAWVVYILAGLGTVLAIWYLLGIQRGGEKLSFSPQCCGSPPFQAWREALACSRSKELLMENDAMVRRFDSSYAKESGKPNISEHVLLPKYLQEVYWWAYLHPNAVRFFERQWIVNTILWGNFAALRDAALDEIGSSISGRNLQVACVYGDFSSKVAERLVPEGSLDIVDVAPVQLENVSLKVGHYPNVALHHQDSTSLTFMDDTYDNVVVFFLLHEQPAEARADTVREALRVTRPGGKLIFVDYHRPHWINPFRYLMLPVLSTLEPFALDIWKNEIVDWVPEDMMPSKICKETYFGGLYQKVVMTPQLLGV